MSDWQDIGPAPMTPKQRKIARHALGLPNRRMVSYRNYYVAAYTPGEVDEWYKMEAAGQAVVGKPKDGAVRCYLTPDGARAVLEPGERLDPEDFPQ